MKINEISSIVVSGASHPVTFTASSLVLQRKPSEVPVPALSILQALRRVITSPKASTKEVAWISPATHKYLATEYLVTLKMLNTFKPVSYS